MKNALVEALVNEIERCKRADSGYKKEAWEYARNEVQRVAGGAIITVTHCKNKLDGFKKNWKVWIDLTNQSGFGVDAQGVVTGPDHALEAYFEAHKDARKFKYKPIKYEKLLRRLFEGVLATGQQAMSVEDLINKPADVQNSIERGSPFSRGESEPIVTPRKRAA